MIDAARNLSLGQNAPTPSREGVSFGSRLTALWVVYVLSLRQHVRGKRWMAMGLLFLAPTALVAVIRMTTRDAPPELMEFLIVFLLMPHALLPLAALVYASGVIRDEQEEQTLTYLLVRPISKGTLYLAKLLAAVTATAVLVSVFTALAYFVIYVGAKTGQENIFARAEKAIAIQVLAVTAYCSLFGLMGLFARKILIWGVLYIFMIEGWMANMPFSIRLITVVYYERIIAYRNMSFLVPKPGGYGRPQDVANEAWQLNATVDPLLSEHPSTKTCVLVLLGASLALALVGAFLCSRREFYVKTPETEKA